jgi:hypothetical protein
LSFLPFFDLSAVHPAREEGEEEYEEEGEEGDVEETTTQDAEYVER